MFYLLYGPDTHKAREKMHTLVDSLTTKKKDAAVIVVDSEHFDVAALDELCYGQGLFEKKHIIVFDTVLSESRTQETILERIKDIAGSENVFIFLEGELSKQIVAKLSKYAARAQVFENEQKQKKATFNIFSLSDALLQRDRKLLWVLFHKAKIYSVSDEEIHSILFWQARVLASTFRAKNASEAGLSPFVFSKSRGFSGKWSIVECDALLDDLLVIFHDARRGKRDFGIALERVIIRI